MIRMFAFCVLFCLGAGFATADVCEDVNDLANDWNEVANFVEDCGEDEDFTDEELKILERYVSDLAEDTYALADALIDLGDAKETRLGTGMRKTMAKLADAASKDRVVDLMDDLVDVIDRTTDYCDEQ